MGMKPRPKPKTLVFCETLAAYCWHVRELDEGEEPNHGGYSGEQPTTICGLRSSWDLRTSVTETALNSDRICTECRVKAKAKVHKP